MVTFNIACNKIGSASSYTRSRCLHCLLLVLASALQVTNGAYPHCMKLIPITFYRPG